jgi:anti-anti-sigma factor
MTFTVAGEGTGTVTVAISGELDIAGIAELDRAVRPALAATPERLVLELAGLRFADSSAIALWVRWAAEVGALELRDVSSLLRSVITTMGLASTLRVAS